MESEDGKVFIKHLAHYVRTHEKALANALQLQRRQQPTRPHVVGSSPTVTSGQHYAPASPPSAPSALAAAFSLPYLSFTSQHTKPAKLSLTPHHLFYLLTRFEELHISVGPMNVRLENLHADSSPGNYVSFSRNRASDSMSIHSVSSVRSVMSGMSSIWSSFGLGGPPSAAKAEKSRAALEADLKYLYSAFTKIPCLKLAPDRKAKLVEGFEEFPFDTAVPLLCFKNVSALEIEDIDIRQFYGWDQLAERLRSLSVKRGNIEDPTELIVSIVLDDMDRRRKRSAKTQSSPIYPTSITRTESSSAPPSPKSDTQQCLSESAPASHPMSRGPSNSSHSSRPRSSSPARPATTASHHRSSRMRRSGSGSSHSSSTSTVLPQHSSSSTNISGMATLPSMKWRFLRHLCLADNSLTSISTSSLAPLAGSLTSLDLSANLFTAVPDALSILTNLRALNLANNMIESLHSLTKSPLPAITAFNLRANRLSSLAGIERLLSLERVDLRNNKLTDPTELTRLTGAPNISELWITHNPFTKTHSSYRIIVFNLFRATPGYTEDVTIDGSGPGMVERRSLMERVAEPPTVPVIKAPQPSSLTPTKVASAEIKKNDNKLKSQESEKSVNLVTPGQVSKSRKKGGRRTRVVELTADESTSSSDDHLITTASLGSRSKSQPHYCPPSTAPLQVHSLLDDPVDSACSLNLPSPESEDWALKGDEYRKKIEALKNEVGSGWLTVLSEESWDASQGNQNGHYNSHSDTPLPNLNRQPMTST